MTVYQNRRSQTVGNQQQISGHAYINLHVTVYLFSSPRSQYHKCKSTEKVLSQ